MSTVAQKLGIKAGNTIAVDGQPLADIRDLLGELPEGVVVSERTGVRVDLVIIAANGLADLGPMLGDIWKEVVPRGRLWVWYRKGANKTRQQGGADPLHRDTLQGLLAEHGMDGVTLISVDETWSAMRVLER